MVRVLGSGLGLWFLGLWFRVYGLGFGFSVRVFRV